MKTVVITGGATGIGLAIAECFLSNRWQVMITSRNIDRLTQVIEELSKRYGDDLIDCFQADVSNEADVIGLQKKTNERFGKADVIVLSLIHI